MGEKNRRLGFLVATLMTVVAVGGGWVAYSEISSRLAVRKDVGPALAAAAPPEALVLGQSLRETAERLDAPYRLGVDRRFRFAKSLLQGAGLNQPAEWKQDFAADDPWSAEHPFPSPPTFEAALSELMSLAGTGAAEEERAPVVEDPGTWILAPESALRVIAHQTKESPKPKDALAATRAAISLLHGGVDRLGTADELGGIALAWLVWTEQARKEQRTAERAVLALELGYAEAAARFGQKLGQGPWRARLTFDDRALAAEAQGAPGLWFQRQSELGRAEERDTWESLPGSVRFGLSGLASSLRSDAFQTLGRTSALCAVPIELRIAALAGADVKEPIRKLEAARSIPAMLMAIPEARGHLIGQAVVHLGVGSGTLSDLGRLDQWTEKAKKQLGSPTATLVFEKYADSLVASCLGGLFEYRFDSQSITPDAKTKMGQALFDSERPLFAQLKTWAELRALSATSPGASGQIIATAKTLDRLGAPAKERLFADLRSNIELNTSDDAAAMRMLVESLDTRPAGLMLAAADLVTMSYDLRYKDFFYEAWVREAAVSDPTLAAWWARYRDASKDKRAESAPRHEAELRGKLDPGIDDWHARQALTRFLRDQGRDAEIPPVVKPWLEAHGEDRGFGREWALCTLASVELRAGHAAEAWKIWEPLAGSYKFSTIQTGTQIALGRNDLLAAQQLSERALTRYPTSPDALGLRLRVLWTAGRPEAARDAMRSIKKVPTLSDLDPVRDTFVDIYSARTPEEAQQAAAMLLQSGLTPSFIEVLAERFKSKERFAHCAAIFELPSDSRLHQLQNDVWAYGCRKKTMGQEQALAWLGSKVPPELRAPMVMFAFERHFPEVLWELPQPTESQQNADSDYLWAMRAASQLGAGDVLDPRVVQHFQKETRMDSYAAIGRYLTGFIDENTVLKAATNARHANEVAYFLGLKAAIDRRVADAIVWYRASVETQEVRSFEYRLAKDELYRYANSGRSLRSFMAARAPAKEVPAPKATTPQPGPG